MASPWIASRISPNPAARTALLIGFNGYGEISFKEIGIPIEIVGWRIPWNQSSVALR
jgi:hypothetical protein